MLSRTGSGWLAALTVVSALGAASARAANLEFQFDGVTVSRDPAAGAFTTDFTGTITAQSTSATVITDVLFGWNIHVMSSVLGELDSSLESLVVTIDLVGGDATGGSVLLSLDDDGVPGGPLDVYTASVTPTAGAITDAGGGLFDLFVLTHAGDLVSNDGDDEFGGIDLSKYMVVHDGPLKGHVKLLGYDGSESDSGVSAVVHMPTPSAAAAGGLVIALLTLTHRRRRAA